MIFHIKKMSELSDVEKIELTKLTYIYGGMRKVLQNDYDHNRVHVCYAKTDNKYVGWALVKRYFASETPIVMVFVKSNHRRRGIGKELVKTLRAKVKKRVEALPHTIKGERLFNSLNIKSGDEYVTDIEYYNV